MASPNTIFSTGSSHVKAGEIYTTDPELGIALTESRIPRGELFISSKVFDPTCDIRAAITRSRGLLHLDHFDQYMLHQPFTAKSNTELQNAWAVLEGVQREGKTKAIGLSNFNPAQIEAILEKATILPAVVQNEYHPYLQRRNLQDFLAAKNIKLEAFSPLTPIIDGKGRPGPLDETLAALAKKYKVGEAEILLNWSLAQGASPVMTTTREGRMRSARKALEISLTPGELKEITETGAKKNVRRWWAEFVPPDDYS